jgi:hypothetical protein
LEVGIRSLCHFFATEIEQETKLKKLNCFTKSVLERAQCQVMNHEEDVLSSGRLPSLILRPGVIGAASVNRETGVLFRGIVPFLWKTRGNGRKYRMQDENCALLGKKRRSMSKLFPRGDS